MDIFLNPISSELEDAVLNHFLGGGRTLLPKQFHGQATKPTSPSDYHKSLSAGIMELRGGKEIMGNKTRGLKLPPGLQNIPMPFNNIH